MKTTAKLPISTEKCEQRSYSFQIERGDPLVREQGINRYLLQVKIKWKSGFSPPLISLLYSRLSTLVASEGNITLRRTAFFFLKFFFFLKQDLASGHLRLSGISHVELYLVSLITGGIKTKKQLDTWSQQETKYHSHVNYTGLPIHIAIVI